jgi:uncharacterized damage-inducible protein DinB
MITLAYVQTMALYNSEMNRRLYGAAAGLDEAARRLPRGAFWHSIHGTFSHLVWADTMWMSRFDGWEKPEQGLAQSGDLFDDFAAMAAVRRDIDDRLVDWSHRLDGAWLAADLTWFSGATGQTQTAPRALLVTHLFNHQTHHRGQIHAMLTAAGAATGDTDLPLVLASR